MKKAIKTILGCACVAAVILAGAENPDGSCNLWWTIACLAIALVSGYAWDRVKQEETIN